MRGGQLVECSLRWIYHHLIEEYARHNGHADLIGELIDGTVGFWARPAEGRAMSDEDDVRRLALALPGVAEIDSDGFDFRVGGRGFVWSYPERLPGKPRVIRRDIAVLYVGDEAEKQALLLGEPGIFFTAPGYGGLPLVMLRLAEVDVARLTELVTDAWRMRAPAELGSRLDPPG